MMRYELLLEMRGLISLVRRRMEDTHETHLIVNAILEMRRGVQTRVLLFER